MPIIYEPRGKAKEYCSLAANLYSGCSHGCIYCYAPAMTYKDKMQFHNNPIPRNSVIASIEKEAPSFKGREILLCFTCDPYQQIDVDYGITRKAIEILHKNCSYVNILTKGGSRSRRDFDLLSKNKIKSKYGATLTFLDNEDSLKFEPNAALPQERIDCLKEAKSLGIETWVSLEPVIKPQQTLTIIEQTKDFVDMFKVGKWNHDKEANEIDWKKFARDAVKMLNGYGLKYYIKNDLMKYL